MFELTCLYCDFKWNAAYVNKATLCCKICGDVNIREMDIRRHKIDYYAGSPPFPEEEDIHNDFFEHYKNVTL